MSEAVKPDTLINYTSSELRTALKAREKLEWQQRENAREAFRNRIIEYFDHTLCDDDACDAFIDLLAPKHTCDLSTDLVTLQSRETTSQTYKPVSCVRCYLLHLQKKEQYAIEDVELHLVVDQINDPEPGG